MPSRHARLKNLSLKTAADAAVNCGQRVRLMNIFAKIVAFLQFLWYNGV
jgi:hypothetical protein